MIKPFVQEHFEHWLYAQPDNREFNFNDVHKCVMGQYFMETGRATHDGICAMSHYIGVESIVPGWLASLLREIGVNNTRKRRNGYHCVNGLIMTVDVPIFAKQVKECYASALPKMREYFYSTVMSYNVLNEPAPMPATFSNFSAPGVLCGSATE